MGEGPLVRPIPCHDSILSRNGASGKPGAVHGTYLGDTKYPWKAIDGDHETGWDSNWDMPAWLMVEFDGVYPIEAVGIAWGSHEHDYEVSLSLDGSSWQEVLAGTSSNEEGGPTVYEYFAINAVDAKYIRINITSTSAPPSHIFQSSVNSLEAYTVPEPATALLVGGGLLGLLAISRRSHRA